jgi:hypothetical protein
MTVDTANVTVSRSGTGWTVDVTACNLSVNVAEKDIQVFHNGTSANTGDYTKTTPTLLTYNGPAFGSATVVEVHRFTDYGPLTVVGYADRLSSSGYNAELDRLHRIIAEGRLNGIGGLAAIAVTLDNLPYNYAVWSLDTIKGATRQAVANQFLTVDNALALKAPLASPVLTGTPTAPSAPASDSSLMIANTGWAQLEFLNKLGGTVTGATDFQGTTTAITRAANDNSTKLATTAYCDSFFVDIADTQTITGAKTFSSTTIVPTKAVDNNTTEAANTAFVVGQAGSASPLIDGTATVGTSLRYSRQDHIHPTDTSRAPLNSPGLTGTPTAPTASATTNTTQIATTAFVQQELTSGLAPKAPLASPALTGTPTAPTAAVNTNTTQLATTAFVLGQAATAAPLPGAATAAVGTATRYAREDHVHRDGQNTLVSFNMGTIAQNSNTDFVLTETNDVGNNMASSIYTAPVSGLYLMTMNLKGSADVGVYLVVNAVSLATTTTRTSTANTFNTIVWIHPLTSGDTIRWRSDTLVNLGIERGQISLL